MKTNDSLLFTVRIVTLSFLGLSQFMLVVFGCFYLSDLLMATYPFARYIRHVSPLVGLFTLVYPFYILVALKTENRRRNLEQSERAVLENENTEMDSQQDQWTRSR